MLFRTIVFTGMEELRQRIKDTSKPTVICDFSAVPAIDESGGAGPEKNCSLRKNDWANASIWPACALGL